MVTVTTLGASGKTAESVATESGVSERTVRRDAEYTEAVERIRKVNGKAASDLLSGSLKVPKNPSSPSAVSTTAI